MANWGTAYIEDGHTSDGYIAGVERLHPPVSFRFRPMLCAKRTRLVRAQRSATDAAKEEELSAVAVSEHVMEWDIKHKGKELPITADVCMRLHPEVLIKLWSVVIGSVPSDAKEDGTNVGRTEVDVEADAKN